MAWLRSGDVPLIVRARPSSIKRDCDRRATSTGEKRLVNVHAKSRLTPEPLRALRSETKGQAGACPDRTRAIPCTVRVGLPPDGLQRVDSNGDSNNSDQRLPAATGDSAQRSHDPRQLGICPACEKQTVGDQRRSAATVANVVAKPLDSARRTWTTMEYRPSLRPVTDGLGRLAHSYGSEGWGFESLRARRRVIRVIQRAITRSSPRPGRGRSVSGVRYCLAASPLGLLHLVARSRRPDLRRRPGRRRRGMRQ